MKKKKSQRKEPKGHHHRNHPSPQPTNITSWFFLHFQRFSLDNMQNQIFIWNDNEKKKNVKDSKFKYYSCSLCSVTRSSFIIAYCKVDVVNIAYMYIKCAYKILVKRQQNKRVCAIINILVL